MENVLIISFSLAKVINHGNIYKYIYIYTVAPVKSLKND